MGLLDFLTETIGVDPGSYCLRITKDGKIIFNEPSQISFNKADSVVSGIGQSIRSTNNDAVFSPVDYSIKDFQAFEMLLRSALKKSIPSNSFLTKSYIQYFAIPTNTTEADKRIYRDSGEHAGAKQIYLIHQSCCSAIGMNILPEKKNFIIIDFGAGKIETTIFANSLPISTRAFSFGTIKIYHLIKNFIRRSYGISVSDTDIENIFDNIENPKIEIQHTIVNGSEIKDLIDNFFSLANDSITEAIEQVSNHHDIEKVVTNGVYFTGGGSKIEFLRNQIKLDSRIKYTISKNPELDCINGLINVIANKERFKDYLMV